ncbi:hypothetical protein AVEN_31790-1 [Araneus ventricosus]|uniref:Uncharacterized protein n=1 Tax=Araneus ventricosus TaxID=182803 RepID=A0A4Y2SNI1_ARAVE|nr:hypothetical protein AVEN_31790-1 [Araneus ventricosus]
MRKSRQPRAVENAARGRLISMGERVAFFSGLRARSAQYAKFDPLGGEKLSTTLVVNKLLVPLFALLAQVLTGVRNAYAFKISRWSKFQS